MRKFPSLPLVLAALALLPFRGDGALTSCCNATTSLASTINDPVAGDEALFKLPTGPASVMLLLDTSGSMLELPQCGDYAWDDASAPATCKSPTLAAPTAPSGKNSTGAFVNVTGTCAPFTDGTGPSLKWMEAVTPTTAYADQGQVNSLLHDCPPWGNGGSACAKTCSGDNCLFDPTAYYLDGSWSASTSSVSATRMEIDTVGSTGLLPACTALDSSGTALKDCAGNYVNLGSACSTCMSNRGFFFYRVNYANGCTSTGSGSSKTYTVKTTSAVAGVPLFKGTFLNANPPKFVSAKKVVKNLAWMDPADTGEQLELDQVRLGVSIMTSSTGGNQRARLIVPLGPDKAASYPPTQLKYQQARQYILSALNYDTAKYTAADGTTLVDGNTTAFKNGYFNPANGSTPLASALFNVGQYFTTKGVYKTQFSSSYELSAFQETSAGDVSAAWVTDTTKTQCSYCWACQNSSVIVITDGSPNSEMTLPTSSTNLSTYDSTSFNLAANCGRSTCATCYSASDPDTDTSSCKSCPCIPCGTATCSTLSSCNCYSPSDTSKQSVLPRVASWLHNTDLRTDFTTGSKQALTVHTIGFNLLSQIDPRAQNILQATASMGGGTSAIAGSEEDLANAVYNAVRTVLPKLNSFSVASANSLQTTQTTTSEAFLTRFKPNDSFPWEGHVMEAFIFDEALNGCVAGLSAQPTVTCKGKTVSADLDGDGTCTGVFMTDADCDRIAEDTVTGEFLKKGTSTPANLPWDAGKVLSTSTATGYRSADETASNARNIFTWVNGAKVAFTAANASTLLPYLNVDSAWCTSLLASLGITSSTPTVECAKEIIYFVRGWDVLDQDGDGCAGPGKTNATTCQRGTKGEERDRAQDGRATPYFWKLGDIAHSSPAVVTAPVHEYLCDTGLEKQCTPAIHGPLAFQNQTPMPKSGTTVIDTYAAYRAVSAQAGKKRVLLVGSNDGMLHAFDAGDWQSTDSLTFRDVYSVGTGAEMWAFVPPDLLPRLKFLLSGHEYMVDGSVMVRDVWVDGSVAQDGATTNIAISGKDGVKQQSEYHTVAIVGRRAGGNQYSALDVTDPTKPTYLWNFPQGCSEDARYMGESWADFAPHAAPIGPVRIVDTTPTAPDATRGFAERWIVAINGGYDPTLTLGRAVFLVDAWTGSTLWRFTDDDWSSAVSGSTYQRPGHLFPVAAGIGLMDIGDTSAASMDRDGFYDTATWGDLGGNLWVARMWQPGVLSSSTSRVGNWFVSRAFEQQRQADDSQKIGKRNEFFYLTNNVYDSATHKLRTLLGSGNRERIMTTTANCEADDLLGCCRAGCTTVGATTTQTYGSFTRSDSFSCASGTMTFSSSSTGTGTGTTCTTGSTFASTVRLSFACPGAGTIADATGSASCDGSGLCTVDPVGEKTISGTFSAPSHNRFYGVWSYGGDTRKLFDSAVPATALAQAKTFDANRFTDTAFTGCLGSSGSCKLVETTQAKVSGPCANGNARATCLATVNDPGWFYEYGDVCPLASCTDAPPWLDEKTGSNSNTVLSCATWNGFRPVGASTSTDPCSGTLGTPASYAYSVDYVSGAPTPTCSCNGSSIACSSSVTAAPSGTQSVVRIGTKSISGTTTITYGSRSINGAATTNSVAGTRPASGSPAYWLEVPRQAHDCRHVAGKTAATTTCE